MKLRETLALLIVLLVGVPLILVFVLAVADAQRRSEEAPFRAVFGNQRFEELRDGQEGFPHYLGNEFRAPDFSLAERTGKLWRLADQRGKVIVMNFWTITCQPCIQEMPTIETLAQIARGWGDVEVVAVSTDQSWNDVRALVADNSPITHLIDPEKTVVARKFGTKLYPETWIIDRRGVVRFRYDGALDWSDPVVMDLVQAYR